jgi:hypothetical protein
LPMRLRALKGCLCICNRLTSRENVQRMGGGGVWERRGLVERIESRARE